MSTRLITLEKQDCANLTYANNSFGSTITYFGVRNFENIDKSFQELLRVLKPNGLFLSLELAKPEKAPMKQLHAIYCRHVIPALAHLHSNEGHSCHYALLHRRLALSDVGIAMGGMGSNAAIEVADVVIQTDQPSKIATAIQVARSTRVVVIQNIVFALGVKFLIMLLGAFGIATMWEAVFADVGVSLIAILNAVRILRKKFD